MGLDKKILDDLDFDYAPECDVYGEDSECPQEVSWRFQAGCCDRVWLLCEYHAKLMFAWFETLTEYNIINCKNCGAKVSPHVFFKLLISLA